MHRDDYPRCKTCRYWERDKWSKPNEGDCALGKTEHGDPVHPTLAYALDSEYYDGTLVTNAEFGCVQHEPKEHA